MRRERVRSGGGGSLQREGLPGLGPVVWHHAPARRGQCRAGRAHTSTGKTGGHSSGLGERERVLPARIWAWVPIPGVARRYLRALSDQRMIPEASSSAEFGATPPDALVQLQTLRAGVRADIRTTTSKWSRRVRIQGMFWLRVWHWRRFRGSVARDAEAHLVPHVPTLVPPWSAMARPIPE